MKRLQKTPESFAMILWPFKTKQEQRGIFNSLSLVKKKKPKATQTERSTFLTFFPHHILPILSSRWHFFTALLCWRVSWHQENEALSWRNGSPFSGNVHLHLYSNQMETKRILFLWAFSTNVWVKEFLGIRTQTNKSSPVSMRKFQLRQFLRV